MKQERKIYDPAFKIKVLELSNGRSNLSESARELGHCINGAKMIKNMEKVAF